MKVSAQPRPSVAALNQTHPFDYRLRPIRFIELWHPGDDWTFKIYGINADARRNAASTIVDQVFLSAAKRTASAALQGAEFSSEAVHKAGCIILHQGILGNWLLLDWWSHQILWNQLLFRSESAERPQFQPVATGIVGCVWELPLMSFERDAWVQSILKVGGSVPYREALNAYFSMKFEGDL
jgi:hypothetical protein